MTDLGPPDPKCSLCGGKGFTYEMVMKSSIDVPELWAKDCECRPKQ